MPGKRRFGGSSNSAADTANENLRAAATRRLGGAVSGGGLGAAKQAGPATSPLAKKAFGRSRINGPGAKMPSTITPNDAPSGMKPPDKTIKLK